MSSYFRRAAIAGVSFALLTGAACAKDSNSKASTKDETGSESSTVLNVPKDYKTIQAAVDASEEGSLILIDEGTYKEAVDVAGKPNITIRGVDRNKVILDGEFKLENGIRVLETDGVVLENMTARNYLSNGFFFTGSDYYRGSYLTAYRNGDYGLYSFDAYHGQWDNSLGWGSPDAGIYIGECYKCDAVIDNIDSQYNGLGYSGTNSGGDLYIVNSLFANNRAGVVPNSGSYELCYPSRDTTIVGNIVHDNNYMDGDGIDVSLLAQGNGILAAGAVRATIERNLVYNHELTGIGLVPFPEEDANDLAPTHDKWDQPCSETHDLPVPEIPADQCKDVPGLLKGCVVIWSPFENSVKDNVVSDSGVADLAVSTVDLLGTGETTETLGNCFTGNTFTTSAPQDLENLAPCGAASNGGDWSVGALDLLGLLGSPAPKPPKDTYRGTPIPEAQESMPNAATAPAPKFTGPKKIDLAAIKVPEKPSK